MNITPDANSKKTQRSNTGATYRKLADMLVDDPIRPVGALVLDYGAGKGHGTKILQDSWTTSTVKSYEPFSDGSPDYHSVDDIPHDQFDLVVCFNVLNVIQGHGQRAQVISNILNCLKPEGHAIIGVRHVRNVAPWTKTAESVGDAEWEFPNGSFQKGYTNEILQSELEQSDSRVRIHKIITGLNPLTVLVSKDQS